MNKRKDFKFINITEKIKTNNFFLNCLLNIISIILFPLIIILGLVFMTIMVLFSFFQNLFFSKTETQTMIVIEKKTIINNKLNLITLENHWNIFCATNKIKLYQKYRGEVRFGPVYLNLKSEPSIEILNAKMFGDWYYIYNDGIFLQQWNATEEANTNLIFINTENFELKKIKESIPSVLWEMKLSENGILELNCDTGNEILKYQVEIKL